MKNLKKRHKLLIVKGLRKENTPDFFKKEVSRLKKSRSIYLLDVYL